MTTQALIETVINNNKDRNAGDPAVGTCGSIFPTVILLLVTPSCVITSHEGKYNYVEITEYNLLKGDVVRQSMPKSAIAILSKTFA